MTLRIPLILFVESTINRAPSSHLHHGNNWTNRPFQLFILCHNFQTQNNGLGINTCMLQFVVYMSQLCAPLHSDLHHGIEYKRLCPGEHRTMSLFCTSSSDYQFETFHIMCKINTHTWGFKSSSHWLNVFFSGFYWCLTDHKFRGSGFWWYMQNKNTLALWANGIYYM